MAVEADFLSTDIVGARSWTVVAGKEVRYDVILADGLIDLDSRVLLDVTAPRRTGVKRRFMVLDANVDRMYGGRIRSYFDHYNVACDVLTISTSEERKTMESVSAVVRALDGFGINRDEPIIAIGGGVLLDIVGVASSLYRRGIPYIRVPTTLVGLVDAGVGVKSGINHDQHKNRLGVYHPPVAALLDRGFLATLDRRHIVNGLSEILKIALVKDLRLFELLVEHGTLLTEERFQDFSQSSGEVGLTVLKRAISGMLEELGGNLWENTLERIVDYGHSISPTIEMMALPELLHGEAVAIDMALFVALSCRRGLLSTSDRDRILGLMCDLGLPITHVLLESSMLRCALADTVRHRGGMQRLPMLTGIGSSCIVNDVSESELVQTVKELGAHGEPGCRVN
ncbi:MAG: sedoheptulose 7-phosphate cyclase [Pseudonocardiaceae bacterium]